MTSDSPDHLDLLTVTAFVEGRLDDAARRQAAAHLAECEPCRRELVAAGEVVAAHRNAKVRRSAGLLTLAAATVVAVVMLSPLSPGGGLRDDGPGPVRTETGAAGIVVLHPSPDAVLERSDGPVAFSWRAVEPGSRYLIRVTDERGAAVWELETGETLVSMPAGITLVTGEPYYWYVDALGADGRSLTTGTHRFQLR